MTKLKPYRVGAIGYVFDKNLNIFLVQLNDYKDNEWNFPGGGRESGETAEENVIRELSEELGVDNSKFKVIYKSPNPLIYDFSDEFISSSNPTAQIFRGQQKDQFAIVYLGNKSDIKIDSKELNNSIWVKIDQLKDYLKFPYQYKNAMYFIASAEPDIKSYLTNGE